MNNYLGFFKRNCLIIALCSFCLIANAQESMTVNGMLTIDWDDTAGITQAIISHQDGDIYYIVLDDNGVKAAERFYDEPVEAVGIVEIKEGKKWIKIAEIKSLQVTWNNDSDSESESSEDPASEEGSEEESYEYE